MQNTLFDKRGITETCHQEMKRKMKLGKQTNKKKYIPEYKAKYFKSRI